MTVRELLQALTRVMPGRTAAIPTDAALDVPCTGVAYDSRAVTRGSVFVALPGQKADGAMFAPQAVAAGAAAVVSERAAGSDIRVPWIIVANARLALALLAAEFFGHPSEQMKVVGITGTNGKTTTSYITQAIFEAAGTRCGLMGTVTYRIGDREIPATRTTPEAPEVQGFMRQMVDAGCGACVMEVSSHALAMHRVDGIRFAAGVFTNLTRDHLDFHQDMESYFAAKRRLFEILPDTAPAVVNVDDPRGASLAEVVRRPVTYAINREADVTPGPLTFGLDGSTFDARMPQGVARVTSKLVGKPNVYNVLAAAGTTAALGVPIAAIEQGLRSLAGVPGRFEVVSSERDDITVVVDYAHTDDALRNLLETARPLAPRQLITVFGAGGDRDRTKRPLMGMVAARLSDVVVITSDNPRSEDPTRIIDEVKLGAEPEARQGRADVVTIVDRREAIQHAIDLASSEDVVLVAGKGHEKYQEIGGRVTPFDDVAVARAALEARREKVAGRMSTLRLTVGWLAAAVAGRIVSGDPEQVVGNVVTDSRSLQAGDFFVALRGPRFDGHAFVDEAVARGATGAVVEAGLAGGAGEAGKAGGAGEAAIVEVGDTTIALQDLAHAVREATDTKVVAITGSAGKTTTKDTIAEFLAASYRVVKNKGNLNNHIGLPLSLMQLRDRPDVAVMELGMNHAGEISTLVAIADPDVRVWINVGDAHLGFFASPDAIADAKAEILERAEPHDLLVCTADDPRVRARAAQFAGRTVTFGETDGASVRATAIEDRGIDGIRARVTTPQGERVIETPLLGRGNLANVLAATAVALDFGVPLETIAERAAALRPSDRRGAVHRLRGGVTLVDDSYNSSPAALRRALDVIAKESRAARRVAVLGEMLELGDYSSEMHRESGRVAASAGLGALFAVGGSPARELAEAAVEAGMNTADVSYFESSDAAAPAIAAAIRAGDVVLVKGSRGTRTDLIADRIAEEFA